jgi:hypothetical protein
MIITATFGLISIAWLIVITILALSVKLQVIFKVLPPPDIRILKTPSNIYLTRKHIFYGRIEVLSPGRKLGIASNRTTAII